MKVLVVFANPRNTNALRLGEEDRTIRACIRRSKHRHGIDLCVQHAATIDDLRRALLDDDFEIVHFSGHGTGCGLAFEDARGRLYVPPRRALAELLVEYTPPLKCVLLNACYSTSQGELTSLGVPFTIAMEGPIADDAAIGFAEGFYDSIGAGKDIEFSYRQGLHALKLKDHPDSSVPTLIRHGETVTVGDENAGAATGVRAATGDESTPLLIGLALDVSGSMEGSINNRVGEETTRLSAFNDALANVTARSSRFLASAGDSQNDIHLFGYAFGLRTGDVCDLFSLVKVGQDVISKAEIEELKERFTSEIRGRYSGGGGGLESLARRYLGPGIVDVAKESIRARAEQEVRSRILGEIQRRLSTRLAEVGDTTLNLHDFVELWKASSVSLADAEGLIFGSTPMCQALQAVGERLRRELDDRSHGSTNTMLLLVSDGESTDGNPESSAEQIRELGVTVIGCYITDTDIVEPRTLVAHEQPDWPTGARQMFNMSSDLPDDSELIKYLLRHGWRVPERARAFVQVNHSEILEELIGVALADVEGRYGLLPKGQ